jgi:hypothetical protein
MIFFINFVDISNYFKFYQDLIYHNEIEKTGVYIVMLTNCDMDEPIVNNVLLDGTIDSLDPCKFMLLIDYYSFTYIFDDTIICNCGLYRFNQTI